MNILSKVLCDIMEEGKITNVREIWTCIGLCKTESNSNIFNLYHNADFSNWFV